MTPDCQHTRARTTNRWGIAIVTAVIAALLTSFTFTPSAVAEPPNEGSNKTLREQLEEAARGWQDAKTQLETSRKRQNDINIQIDALQTEVDQLTTKVDEIATEAYLNGGSMELTAALSSTSFSTLVDKMSIIDQMSWQNQNEIKALKAKRGELTEQRAKLAEEIHTQEQHEQEMAQRKKDAETALMAVDGHPASGFLESGKPPADPAPRGSDGGWPSESCSEDDPTGGPCLTPRTLHAYNEARKVGFTNYTSCNHPASYGEHPKGRACDFAADPDGFGDTATGDAKAYGNRLAAWFVENADALGVMYVIWYKQIWMPSTGWRNYSGGGSPSADHTNHVHLSEY